MDPVRLKQATGSLTRGVRLYVKYTKIISIVGFPTPFELFNLFFCKPSYSLHCMT